MKIFNLFISGLITFIMRIKVEPCIELIENYNLAKGCSPESLVEPLALLRFASFLVIALSIYFVLELFLLIIKLFDNKIKDKSEYTIEEKYNSSTYH